MRLLITGDLPRAVAIPLHQQHHALSSLVYTLLRAADPEYARFLHDEGYGGGGDARRYKLFCFSGLRCSRRRIAGETLWLGPGRVTWQVASPLPAFLQAFATGLLACGQLEIGSLHLPIAQTQCLADPDFASGFAAFTCLTPIVAALPLPDGGTRYLRPCEGEAFRQAVGRNLLHKYHALHGQPFPDAEKVPFDFAFNADYMADPRHRQGTKLTMYKGIQIVGAQAPFTVSAAPALLQLMYDCGAGEKNAGGFGMVQVQEARF